MREIINGKIVFDTEAKCTKCGAIGAYDLTSDFLCIKCMPQFDTITENKIIVTQNDDEKLKRLRWHELHEAALHYADVLRDRDYYQVGQIQKASQRLENAALRVVKG